MESAIRTITANDVVEDWLRRCAMADLPFNAVNIARAAYDSSGVYSMPAHLCALVQLGLSGIRLGEMEHASTKEAMLIWPLHVMNVAIAAYQLGRKDERLKRPKLTKDV